MPADVALPPIYLLGSSDYSAQLAAQIGAGFSFAHHFSDFDPVMPMTIYRDALQAVARRAEPHAILGCHVVCADTDEEADRLASTVDLNFVRRRQGDYLPLPSPEEAAALRVFADRQALIARNRARLIVGSPTDGDGAARAADREHQGRRGDDHHHDLRSRGAKALLRVAGAGVRRIVAK